jgi:DNA-binding response OmpR family regulator
VNSLRELKNLTVLYAEDDTVLRRTTKKTLEMVVKKVYAVSNGSAALDVYENYSVNIVILDIYMKYTSGIEVAQKIRTKNDSIPIIIISASVATEDLLAACRLNLVEYIQKPLRFDSLLKVLRSAAKKLKMHGCMTTKVSKNLSYDYMGKTLVYADGSKVILSKSEIDIIELLLANRGQIVTYETLMESLHHDISDGALKTLVFRLRKKMKDDAVLGNLSKVGYFLQQYE